MNKAVANIFARKGAEGGEYIVEAGIEAIIDTVKRWKDFGMSAEDRAWLEESGYPKDYINYVHEMLINDPPIQIDVSKKRVFFSQEPAVRLVGPIGLIKMLESVSLDGTPDRLAARGIFETSAEEILALVPKPKISEMRLQFPDVG